MTLVVQWALFAISVVKAYPTKDQVTALPGWTEKLPSRMFAGFVDAGSDEQDGQSYQMYEHYMFIESERDPTNDPLVIWTNGGPGASSFFGLFIELGPFWLTDASLKTKAYNETGIPTLFRNEYSWSKEASILILNSPPPVGYSYCDPVGPSGNGTSCGSWNDTRTALHNYEFLINWFKAFPEYSKHDLYITGESYAGIYVPTLVREIVTNKNDINLKGYAVGDGCLGSDILCGGGPGAWNGPFFHMEFMHGHGQFSDKTYEAIQVTCSKDELIYGVKSDDCNKLIGKMNKEVGPYYSYNLYDECWYQNAFKAEYNASKTYWGPPTVSGALNDYPCGGGGALVKWINALEVKTALHVPKDAYYFSGDNGAGFMYNVSEPNITPFHKWAATESDLRVLIYNGDTDPGLNSLVMQNWTRALGLNETESWRAWTLDGKQRVGGYVTRYEGNFDALTIRGSGHMVPEYKPWAAYEMISRWLKQEDWQRVGK
mmetsp:Transcript_23287/g.34858  ORF Transcript_23287/g.34858 Transcript_23287/m.34858 type:complete len:487 (+) Transcript_23287:3-1463(+)